MSFLNHFLYKFCTASKLESLLDSFRSPSNKKNRILVFLLLISALSTVTFSMSAESDFVVVIDPGHGGKDYGAIDNDAREKDINLAVAKRLAEMIDKKIGKTKVILTRDNDTFISLQERANIANKAKGNLFISIHTNSVDTKNKNRSSIAGASVYTLGNHKDDANMGVARRENSVIELENGYQQKYSGFDPNKDESYIIFEMAQKNDITRSNRFAKNVQENLVKYAGRKDRGVHQAGFWVLWSTSMPSVLVELDFICNPESAKYMTSKEGVDEMADAIFKAVRLYEQNWRQSERMAQNHKKTEESNGGKNNLVASEQKYNDNNDNKVVAKGTDKKNTKKKSSKNNKKDNNTAPSSPRQTIVSTSETVAVAYVPQDEERDLSHDLLKATKNQKKPRSTADGRRRRSSSARKSSAMRNVEGEIKLYTEFTGKTERVQPEQLMASSSNNDSNQKSGKKEKNSKKAKKGDTKENKSNKQFADNGKNQKSNIDNKDNKDSKNKKEKADKNQNNKKTKELSPAMKYKLEQEQKEKDAKKQDKENRKSLRANAQKSDAGKASATSASTKKSDSGKSNASAPAQKSNVAKANNSSSVSSEQHGGKRKSLKSHQGD